MRRAARMTLALSAVAIAVLGAPARAQAGGVGTLPPGLATERVLPTGALPNGVVATVNGRTISSDTFHRALVAESGLAVLRTLVKEEIIRAAAAEAGVFFTAETIEREAAAKLQEARSEMAARVGGPTPSLEEVLAMAGQDLDTFKATLRAKTEIEMTLDTLVVLERLATERVRIRLMQLRSADEATEILHLLGQGADFGKLALQRSLHASSRDAGELQPFARGRFKEQYQAIEDAAFALTTPGTVSPVIRVVNEGIREDFFLVRLLERLPAQTGGYPALAGAVADERAAAPPTAEELNSWMAARMERAQIVIDPK